jgi:hypothetical protein
VWRPEKKEEKKKEKDKNDMSDCCLRVVLIRGSLDVLKYVRQPRRVCRLRAAAYIKVMNIDKATVPPTKSWATSATPRGARLKSFTK